MAFDPNQFALPIFANLILLAIPLCLMGAFLIYRQRGPVLIMLTLFAIMPAWSGLSHWYKSEQRNHWFGFWFGHDMFTPPYTDPKTGQLTYDNDQRTQLLKNPTNATNIYPEMDRNTILFGGTDPGRFCPTYSIFCDSFIPHSCQPVQDQKFDRRDCYLITQNALADGTYLDYLRAQYNRSQQIDPPFFSRLVRYVAGLCTWVPLAASFWRAPDGRRRHRRCPGGRRLQLARQYAGQLVYEMGRPRGKIPARARGVSLGGNLHSFPGRIRRNVSRNIPKTPTADSNWASWHPGEYVNTENGHVQVSGQAAVMKINGLLCKVIFDHNPTNSFYVEESFPLDWMYPYETPFGIIMKINRNPLPELSDEVFKLDHEFWTKYSKRLCGDWITYDTTVQADRRLCGAHLYSQ